MAEEMKLQVITPDKVFYDGNVTMVEMDTRDGQMGVYPKHVPTTVVLRPGLLKLHEDNQIQYAALHGGFIEILPEKVTILAEAVEWPMEIDGARANEARIRAERRLKEGNPEIDVARAEAALQRALARLNAVEHR